MKPRIHKKSRARTVARRRNEPRREFKWAQSAEDVRSRLAAHGITFKFKSREFEWLLIKIQACAQLRHHPAIQPKQFAIEHADFRQQLNAVLKTLSDPRFLSFVLGTSRQRMKELSQATLFLHWLQAESDRTMPWGRVRDAVTNSGGKFYPNTHALRFLAALDLNSGPGKIGKFSLPPIQIRQICGIVAYDDPEAVDESYFNRLRRDFVVS